MKNQTINECMQERLLRQIPKDPAKSRKSIKVAEKRLREAEKAVKLEIPPYAIMQAYTAMFHAARALLYQDGIQEKSHWATYIYLKEKYADKIPANLLNIHRIERHETLYGLEYNPTQKEAQTAIDDAKKLINTIKKQLQTK
ncbi:MAG TPA: HEPN domain-containing protein [Candidatus Altiarchaeales archaeon]|nr:HEPN domain-containing protein [Candidatus Altiarchaeales archaeon]